MTERASGDVIMRAIWEAFVGEYREEQQGGIDTLVVMAGPAPASPGR